MDGPAQHSVANSKPQIVKDDSMARASHSSTFMSMPVAMRDVKARGASFMQPIEFQPKVRLTLDVMLATLLEVDDVIDVAISQS